MSFGFCFVSLLLFRLMVVPSARLVLTYYDRVLIFFSHLLLFLKYLYGYVYICDPYKLLVTLVLSGRLYTITI